MRDTVEPEVRALLRRVLGDAADGALTAHQLKRRVYRVEAVGSPPEPRCSVVVKQLEPLAAQRCQLTAERWLPALGLADRCARLVGTAADPGGAHHWHVYEDLGDETLAADPSPERVNAAVDLLATLHTRAAGHSVLPDARRYGCAFGIEYFTANVRDALRSLDLLAAADLRPPADCAGVVERLQERLSGMLGEAGARALLFEACAGPDTLLHGDVWTINAFVVQTAHGPCARLVDWERVGVGPWSYDVSTFLMRFPRQDRPAILARYCRSVSAAGWRLPAPPELQVLFDTAERARYVGDPIAMLVAETRAQAHPRGTFHQCARQQCIGAAAFRIALFAKRKTRIVQPAACIVRELVRLIDRVRDRCVSAHSIIGELHPRH